MSFTQINIEEKKAHASTSQSLLKKLFRLRVVAFRCGQTTSFWAHSCYISAALSIVGIGGYYWVGYTIFVTVGKISPNNGACTADTRIPSS